MALYKALYGRWYHSPVCWFESEKARLLSTNLIRDALEKGKLIQGRLLTAQSRKKCYADMRVHDVAFMVGEKVLLRVYPMKGKMRFGKKCKLSPRHIGSFEMLERVGEVTYRLDLPPSILGVHHVSMLCKYHEDKSHVLDFSTVLLDENLAYEEELAAILDRQVWKLKSKEIASAKVELIVTVFYK
ncbi:uncharacterized protein [Nicotiana tomentosiformis]|uniref:uncharacterized protein n=1 Tax=Nicotiana tomentosiformis TaxID=4098 RepID=UPI00388CDCCA